MKKMNMALVTSSVVASLLFTGCGSGETNYGLGDSDVSSSYATTKNYNVAIKGGETSSTITLSTGSTTSTAPSTGTSGGTTTTPTKVLEWSIAVYPEHGKAVLEKNLLTYTPSSSFAGSDKLVAVYGTEADVEYTIAKVSYGVSDKAPIFISTPPAKVVLSKGDAYTFAVEAIDADGDTLTYSSGSFSWLKINPSTGVLSGVAQRRASDDANTSSLYEGVGISVTDGTYSTSYTFDIEVI